MVTDNKPILTNADIREILGVSRMTAYRRICELKALGLGEIGRGRYLATQFWAALDKLSRQG